MTTQIKVYKKRFLLILDNCSANDKLPDRGRQGQARNSDLELWSWYVWVAFKILVTAKRPIPFSFLFF